ncbi:aminotransferase class III-fold pyridoxal phosphate-dependent enzyme [Coprobacillaceae bacterium CR2/5/TPMF4]|nr:aminotransferase class III-fold pyridoxal phosphate-dependent enzyme [Coprobacillaceae bacterium CR2/5/TPMF4]
MSKKLITPRTAAIIVEPVQGEGGVYVCTKEFLTGIRELCDEHDIVMILDEVQCGMGRTGTIMTYFQYDLLPDIVCLAKGIGAGFPMGAFVANKKLVLQ